MLCSLAHSFSWMVAHLSAQVRKLAVKSIYNRPRGPRVAQGTRVWAGKASTVELMSTSSSIKLDSGAWALRKDFTELTCHQTSGRMPIFQSLSNTHWSTCTYKQVGHSDKQEYCYTSAAGWLSIKRPTLTRQDVNLGLEQKSVSSNRFNTTVNIRYRPKANEFS